MSELLTLGVSHKTAPVALRERLAFSNEQAGEFAAQALATADVREAVVISTCNRTEIYLVVGDAVRAEADVLGLLARRSGIRLTELAEVTYSPRNCDAARQLYRVTAGLESMVVGEAEVQGQVRRAHEAAMSAGSPADFCQSKAYSITGRVSGPNSIADQAWGSTAPSVRPSPERSSSAAVRSAVWRVIWSVSVWVRPIQALRSSLPSTVRLLSSRQLQ